MTKREFIRKKIMEHMIGPVGSVILHILLIYAAIHFIVFDTRSDDPDITIEMVEMVTVELEDLLQEIEPELEPPEMDMDFPVDMDMPLDTPNEATDFTQDASDVDFADLNILNVDSPLTMIGLFAGRGETGRAALLRRYGGRWGQQTEAAVLRALEWLRINQNENGSWAHGGPSGAMTGLGLLTFLAHGETVDSEKYGDTVRRAIEFLRDNQNSDGNFRNTGPHHVYGHGIATYAIAEAYAMTRIPGLLDVMDRGVQIIVRGQQASGGWDYGYSQSARRDLSVSAFHIQALKAAQLAGSEVEGIEEALEKSIRAARTHRNANGGFSYSPSGNSANSMTGIGALMFQLTGHGRDPVAVAAVTYLRENESMDWSDPGNWAFYRWYYITQAMFQGGGPNWVWWNDQFAPAFINGQNEDGSWSSPSNRGTTGPGQEAPHGPVYATTLAALSLQVYYRILPTFAVVDEIKEEQRDESQDVTIDII
jgi:hypothetical protein